MGDRRRRPHAASRTSQLRKSSNAASHNLGPSPSFTPYWSAGDRGVMHDVTRTAPGTATGRGRASRRSPLLDPQRLPLARVARPFRGGAIWGRGPHRSACAPHAIPCVLDTGDVAGVDTNDTTVHRLLRVQSDVIAPTYYVVELATRSGEHVANVAITPRGEPIMAEDARGTALPRPIGLSDALRRVRANGRESATAARYVYFHNTAEKGISICRPLVEVATGGSPVFMNSAGEAFDEEKQVAPSQLRALRFLGRW
jgi:hypothetical protein